jgi:2-oxoglutarate dehydrogenase E1 component
LERLEQQVTDALEASLLKPPVADPPGFTERWGSISSTFTMDPVDTKVLPGKLTTLALRLAALPAGFIPHTKIAALIQKRCEAVLKGEGIDWGTAETLAYATLLDQGYSVRLSGQDSRRGTFNHRHCVVIDSQNEQSYVPLEKVVRDGAHFQAWNSLLSEFGVLGFDYGYSLEEPNCLTLWEAQFGDFANGAQVVIDQFIASGETKWNRASGLVMLLPHGYEGQGAEHSSARIERYLQLCSSDNMIVACPSTPAQMFHLLRRQMIQAFRKPLVIFTPKSLLRHPKCTSTVTECCDGAFHTCLSPSGDFSAVKQLLFCCGKLYYELEEERLRLERNDVMLVRIEQLYPLDRAALQRVITQCGPDCSASWVQEEPENMGAWRYIENHFRSLAVSLTYIGRGEDSSAAVGSHRIHGEQQAEILRRAFTQ